MAQPRRPAIYGPEPWEERHGQVWSHWDRWYALVAVADHDGDLAGLVAALEGGGASGYLGEDAQAKLAHLDDLVARFDVAGLDPERLLGDDELDRTVLTKARRKVLDQALSGRDLTAPMRHTPRRRFRHRALYASWPAFPADPATAYTAFEELVERADIWAGESFELVRNLESAIAGLVEDAGDDVARLLAVRRAALSAVAEAAEVADDSYGQIGELGEQLWRDYTATSWREVLDPGDYWRDVCQLVAFDDYAHLHERETLPFRRARMHEADLIVGILDGLAQEYTANRLRWHTDQARQAVVYVMVATRRVDRFIQAATELGGGHWRPVALLAETAAKAGHPDIAAAVFDAADLPGPAGDHLRRLRTKLLDDTATTIRHLQAVRPHER